MSARLHCDEAGLDGRTDPALDVDDAPIRLTAGSVREHGDVAVGKARAHVDSEALGGFAVHAADFVDKAVRLHRACASGRSRGCDTRTSEHGRDEEGQCVHLARVEPGEQ